MNRALLFLAAVLFVASLLMVLSTSGDREETVGAGGIKREEGRSDIQSAVSDEPARELSERKLGEQSIETIRELGYRFSADRINERSASGNVTLVTPDGGILKSNHLAISVDGDNVYLKGEILVEMTSENEVVRMKYTGENASAKIGLDGQSLSFEGGSTVTSIRSNSPE